MNEKDLLELYGLMESDPNMKGAFTVETLSSALSSESGAKEIHSYLEGRSDTKGAFGDFKSLMITPQKKSPSGSPSQGGLQGSQDGITAPSGGIEVPTAALPGLGGVEPQTQDRMGVIGQSLERGPKEDIGQYFLEGQPVSRSRMMNALKDRSFMESIAQGAGRDRIDIRNDQALLEFAQRQFESRKTNDTWDSLMLSVARGGQMVLGAVEYADDLVSELTGIPNTIYTLVGAAASPQMAAKGASGEIKKGVGELIDKFQQDASTAEERRFKVEEDFIALVSEGNVSEAVNMAINTTVESAVPSLMIGLGTLATGGGAGIAAIARGGAAVTPFFIGGEYVEQEQMAEDAREGLADPEKSVSLEQLKIMNLRGAAKYLRPALRGSAEMGGEAISFGLWKGSAKIAAQSMKSLVKGTASSLGEEAAKEVAETGAKELWKRMFESVVKAPLTEGFAEFSTFAAQELTDTLLGISAKSPARIMREGLNAWALGAASGGVMSAPGGAATSIALSAKGLKAAKSYLDDVIAFDPQGLEELNEAVNIMRKRGQEQQASAIEENLAKREKAVKAVPKDKVSDTETVDTVQEIQELEEQKKGLLPVWQEPIQAEIDAKTEKLKEGIAATPVETASAEAAPTETVEQAEEVAPAETLQPTPPTDAVQEQSTESVPVRQQPEARQGVREEDTQGQEAPQEGETVQEEVTAENLLPDFKAVSMESVTTDEARFQGRESLDEENVQKIIDEFDERKLDPIVAWRDPETNALTVLSGHHRYEAAKRMGRKDIPVREFIGTEQEAIDFAKDSNVMGKQETPVERAGRYRQMREQGISDSEIQRRARSAHGKDASFMVNISRLDPKGKAMDAMRQFNESTDKSTRSRIEAIADWIGALKKTHPDVSKAQESEMFDHLLEVYSPKSQRGKISTRNQFVDVASAVIDRMKNNGTFNEDAVLNLANVAGKGALEMEYDVKLEEAKQREADARKAIETRRAELVMIGTDPKKNEKKLTPSQIDRALVPYEDALRIAIREVGEIRATKETAIAGDRAQISLFDEIAEPTTPTDEITERRIERILEESREQTQAPKKDTGRGQAKSKPSKPKVEPTEKTDTQKLLEEKMAERKALADRIRDKKIGGVSFADPLFGAIGISKTLYDGALELAAKQVEKGTKIGTAIANAIKYIDERMAGKRWDKGLFGRHLNDQFKMMVSGKEVEVKRDLSEETIEVVNGWYSPLEKTIKDVKADSLTAKEWLDRVRSKEGEDMWTGLRGMLEAKNPKDRVSKRELLNYLKDNRVDVVEVVKGGIKSKGMTASEAREKLNEGYEVYYMPPDNSTEFQVYEIEESESSERNYYLESDFEGSSTDFTKFSSYQLEGEKTNYKEVLVTLPPDALGGGKKSFVLENPQTGGTVGSFDTQKEAEDFRTENRRGDLAGFTIRQVQSKRPDRFSSTHFDEPNILVHLRMNTRKDADGNKVLFLEEVQSDFGQSYKKGTTTIQAPFITDTNSWVKLGVKVALKEAVAQGVDRIAWTTGEQQNERYSLEKQVDRIQWNPWGYGPKEKGRRTVSIDMPNGEVYGMDVDSNGVVERSTNKDAEGKRLDNVIGKEIADKIMSNERGDLSGDGLKLGGKGMKGFYGSPKEGSKGILGSVMEAVTGQKVDGINLDTGDAKYDAEKYNGSQNISSIPGNSFIKEGDWIIKDPNGDFIWSEDGNVSKSEAIENFKETSEEAGTPVSEGSGVVIQPSISITPELRSAVEKGQPLFGTSNVELAKAIRDKKIKGGLMFADPTGGFVALSAAIYNKAVDIIADQVEKGTSLGKAVQSAIEYIDSVMGGKKWDRKAFKEDFMGVEAQQTAPEKAPKKQPSEKASERQSQKRYTTRVIKNLEKLADKKELLEAVRETGTKESVISWKSLHPIALEMVEDIFSDPKSVNEKMKELSDVIDNTTNRNYRENKPLSTLHALIYHIAIDRLANEGMTQEYKIWVSAFQDLGRSKGQFNSAMQEAASSYAVKNLVVRPVFDADMEKLNEKAEDGETRAKHVEDVKELYDAILQSDELIELLQKRVGELEGQVEYYRDTQRPEASQPLDRKRQLKKEKDEALQMIRRGLAKARGQANVGIPINEDLINGTIALAKYYVKVGIYKAADLKKMVMKEVVDPSKDNPDMILQVADAIDSYLASDEFKDSRKEAMKAAFVDALESRAKAMMGNERATRKSAEQVLLDSLLSKLASDIGKDAKKGSKAYEQRLREALENADFSDSVWKAAMENVRIWMDMQDIAPTTKAEILSRLEDTASAFMEKPFAKSDIRKAIREGEKDLGTSLADVVKRHFTEQNSTLKTLAEKLVSELGLSAEAAKKYEQAIIEEARSYMNDKRMSAIQKALGVDSAGMPKEKAKKVNKAIVDRMIEGVNLGMLDDDLFRGMFAEKYGLIDPTPEMVANINRFNDLIHLHEGTDVSRRYKKELMDYIETLKPWNVAAFAKLTQGLVIKNMLNGLATFLNISAGSMYSFFTGIGPSVLMNIPATKAFFDEYSRAGLSSSSRRMFKDIMIDGRSPIDEGLGGKFDDGEVTGDRFEYFVKEYDVKKLRETFANAKTPKEVGTATLIAAARAFSLISQLSNFAKAFDVLLSNRGTEFEMFLKYYNEMSKEAGHPLRARFDPSVSKQFIDRLREKMAYDPDARAEIEASVDEQIAGMKARGEKVGAATRQVLIREGMVARRDMKEYRQAMDRVRSYLLMEDPNGLLGQMYDTQRGWGTIRGDEGAAKALAKLGYSLTFGLFLRISITATQRSIENIPVAGLLTPGFLYDYTRTDPSDPRSPKKWMGMFERKGGELVKNEMYDHKAMKRRLAVHAMIAGLTVAAGWNMFVLKEVEDEEEDEEGNIKTVKKTRLDINPNRVIEFTAHSGEFFKAEQFSGLDTQGSIDRRRDYYFRVKIGGKWENVAPTRLNPYFLFPTAVLGGIADDITLGMSKNERKRDAILNTWDDLAMGLAEFSFAGNAKLIRNTIYATQRGGVLEGAAEVGEFVLKPARVAIYPNALRDVYKEMRAIQGQEEKYGEGMLGALSNDIPVLEDMVGISSYDIFGYPKKVTSKFIQVGTDIPVAGIFIDNVIDHKYRNEERFDTDAWKLKMTYFPDVEIQGYWPKNTKNVTVTREMKNEASKVYGEFMRSAIEATPKDVWETLSQGDIDRVINGRIMSDGSRKGSGIHHAAVEVAKASIGISEMGKLAEIENSVRTELKEVREKSVQTEADEAIKSYLVDALQTISDVRKQLEQKTKK